MERQCRKNLHWQPDAHFCLTLECVCVCMRPYVGSVLYEVQQLNLYRCSVANAIVYFPDMSLASSSSEVFPLNFFSLFLSLFSAFCFQTTLIVSFYVDRCIWVQSGLVYRQYYTSYYSVFSCVWNCFTLVSPAFSKLSSIPYVNMTFVFIFFYHHNKMISDAWY